MTPTTTPIIELSWDELIAAVRNWGKEKQINDEVKQYAKIIEEAGEVWIAAEYQTDAELAEEISQLMYWTQVIMLARGITPDDIYKNL